MNPNKFQDALQLFDNANSADPNKEYENGRQLPKELLYSKRMLTKLGQFLPNASEHLQLAACAQHIERWKSPRTNYPEGRTGYKKWRAELSLFHANRAGELLAQAGYPQNDIERVKFLIQKRQLSRDAETQALEDVICLVFIEFYLAEFAKKHSEEKLIEIIRKTWKKMSTAGHNAALQLPLDKTLFALVEKAIS